MAGKKFEASEDVIYAVANAIWRKREIMAPFDGSFYSSFYFEHEDTQAMHITEARAAIEEISPILDAAEEMREAIAEFGKEDCGRNSMCLRLRSAVKAYDLAKDDVGRILLIVDTNNPSPPLEWLINIAGTDYIAIPDKKHFGRLKLTPANRLQSPARPADGEKT